MKFQLDFFESGSNGKLEGGGDEELRFLFWTEKE